MAKVHRPWIVVQHGKLRLAISIVLQGESSKRLPPNILGMNLRRKIDFAPGTADTVIQLIVVVNIQRFTEQANLVEHLARPRTEIHRIGILSLVAHMEWRRYSKD